MRRPDELQDFRLFKFSIQAFANAFLEEVGRGAVLDFSVANWLFRSSPDRTFPKIRYLCKRSGTIFGTIPTSCALTSRGRNPSPSQTPPGISMPKRAKMAAGSSDHSAVDWLGLPLLSLTLACGGRGNHIYGIHEGPSSAESDMVRPHCRLGFHGRMMCCPGSPRRTHEVARSR